ncbi:MAG TPA: hypothetical protein VE779_07725, partial [Candidatus Angelobacter sp.]|nr:hypothetical protein [Candidatus Angelobacter sp.]
MGILQKLAQAVVAGRKIRQNLANGQGHPGQMLAGAIMQITRYAAPFVILRFEETPRHVAQGSLGPFAVPAVDQQADDEESLYNEHDADGDDA